MRFFSNDRELEMGLDSLISQAVRKEVQAHFLQVRSLYSLGTVANAFERFFARVCRYPTIREVPNLIAKE